MNDSISGGQPTAAESQSNGWDDSIEITSTSQPIEPPKPEPEVQEEPEPEESETEEQPKPKKPKGFVKKLNQKDEEIAAERQRNAQLLAEIEKLRGGKTEPQKADELKEPNPVDYEDPNAPDRGFGRYQKALREYDGQVALNRAKEELKAELGRRDEMTQAQKEEHEAQQVLVKHAEKYTSELESYEAENPGTAAKIQSALDEVNPPETLMKMVLFSDKSVEMADYLADNREELQAISQMQPLQMAISLARLEGMLQASKSSPQSPKRQTQATAPIKPIGGSKAKTSSPTDFNKMSQEDFDKWLNE